MNDVYHLSSKTKIILTIIVDILFTLLIPAFIILLTNNYNVAFLILIFFVYLFVFLISIFNYRKRIILGNDCITFIELKRVIIPTKDIVYIKSTKHFIEIKTKLKNYRFSGYTLFTSINVLKNDELVEKMNKFIAK